MEELEKGDAKKVVLLWASRTMQDTFWEDRIAETKVRATCSATCMDESVHAFVSDYIHHIIAFYVQQCLMNIIVLTATNANTTNTIPHPSSVKIRVG